MKISLEIDNIRSAILIFQAKYTKLSNIWMYKTAYFSVVIPSITYNNIENLETH